MLSISQRLAKEGVDYDSRILTNGSLLSEEKIARLDILHLDAVQISMDGIAGDHDRRRCYKNGTPSFQHIITNLSLLLKRTDVKVNVKVALDKQNAGGYNELKAFLSERFPSYVKSGQLYVSCSHVLDKTGFDTCATCYTREELFRNGIACLEAGQENPWFSPEPQPARACMFRQPFSLNVDSEGYMYHCMEQFGNPRYRIGNIKNKSVNFSRLAQGMFAKDPFDDPECRNCKVLPLCGGGCPMDRLKHAETDGKEPDYCSIYRGHIEQLIPYMYKSYKKK
ncbi:radical SAM protein [Xylanibacter rodentium]|nr:radical SAM protein [Xylanibacter rodentium]